MDLTFTDIIIALILSFVLIGLSTYFFSLSYNGSKLKYGIFTALGSASSFMAGSILLTLMITLLAPQIVKDFLTTFQRL